MKRFLSLILSILLLISLCACSNEKKPEDTDKEAETTKNFQSYDELEYKSDDRFTDEEVFVFTHEEGEFTSQRNGVVSIFQGGVGISAPLSADSVEKYNDIVTPFGVTVGDDLSKLCDGFSLDCGYAAYVVKGGDMQMFESEKKTDIKKGEGGNVYFGYALDGMGNWAFMDYHMLAAVLRGELIISGAEGDYDVVVYSCVLNGDEEITQITQIYGELNTVMAYIVG